MAFLSVIIIFLQLLIEQYYSGGDPFSSIPAEIRGEIALIQQIQTIMLSDTFRLAEFDTVKLYI